MAVTHSTAARNAIANAVDDQVNSGTTDAAGDLVIFEDSLALVRITLDNPAFGNATNGQITMLSLPRAANAIASGTANRFEVQNRDNEMVLQGSVTATGGGGDLTLDNTLIASGQIVELTSFTYTASA